MKPSQYKIVGITPPAAIVDNAAFTTATLDTLGFDYVEIYVYLGAMDIAATVLKVQESDDSGMSGAADITGTRFGTDATEGGAGAASVLPTATDDNKFFKFEIDMRGRKRYLDLNLTGGDGSTGTFAAAFALLHQGEQCPTTAAQKGCAQVMRVPALSA
jgi:hypothetical protein